MRQIRPSLGIIKSVLVLVVFAWVLVSPLQVIAQKNAIGKAAPNCEELLWVRPAAVSNETFKNKVVIFEFFATWCKPCIDLMPKVNAIEAQFADKGVEVVAVSWNAKKEVIDSFISVKAMPQKVCIDVKSDMFLKYFGAWGIPYAIMVGRDGKVVWEGKADSLTTDLVGTYLLTDSIPADPTLEERTLFELKVSNALASDKNVISSNHPMDTFMEGRSQIPSGIIINVVNTLGYKNAEREVIGEEPPGFFNFTLRLDSTTDRSRIRDGVLSLLDVALGTKTKIEHRLVEVLSISISDSSLLTLHRTRSANTNLLTGTEGKIQLENVTIGSMLSYIKREYGLIVIYDLSINYRELYDFEIRRNDLAGVQNDLLAVGLSLVKSIKSVPYVVVQANKM
ncbi:MAG: TlpA family protein disulfide reductase [Ignavibacteria bacterium]|nr:TlpA family protein disulfide reductase [Ignavibacteria bacterium]